MDTKIPKKTKNGESGFTLVELIVAAVVLLVAVGAIVAVVRMGVTMQISDQHRRQARTIVTGVFERWFATYNGNRRYFVEIEDGGCAIIIAPPILGAPAPVPNDVEIEDYAAFVAGFPDGCDGELSESNVGEINGVPIAFDDDGEVTLRGNMTITITSEFFTYGDDPIIPGTTRVGDVIKVHAVEIALTWTETNAAEDEVRFTKRLGSQQP